MISQLRSISLERGWFRGYDPRGDLRIVSTAGVAPVILDADGPVLSIHWLGGRCAVNFFINGSATPISYDESAGSIEFTLDSVQELSAASGLKVAASGFKVISQKLDWTRAPHLPLAALDGLQILFVSPCGAEDAHWTDGWMGHLSARTDVYSLVSAGGAARILLETDSSGWTPVPVLEALDSLDQNETNRQCIVAALREMFVDRLSLPLKIDDKSREGALAAVLFAQAFPRHDLCFTSNIAKRLLPRPWKCLIDALSAVYVESLAPALPLLEVQRQIPLQVAEGVFQHINSQTRIFDYREWTTP